jgi:hypothetical protein
MKKTLVLAGWQFPGYQGERHHAHHPLAGVVSALAADAPPVKAIAARGLRYVAIFPISRAIGLSIYLT